MRCIYSEDVGGVKGRAKEGSNSESQISAIETKEEGSGTRFQLAGKKLDNITRVKRSVS